MASLKMDNINSINNQTKYSWRVCFKSIPGLRQAEGARNIASAKSAISSSRTTPATRPRRCGGNTARAQSATCPGANGCTWSSPTRPPTSSSPWATGATATATRPSSRTAATAASAPWTPSAATGMGVPSPMGAWQWAPWGSGPAGTDEIWFSTAATVGARSSFKLPIIWPPSVAGKKVVPREKRAVLCHTNISTIVSCHWISNQNVKNKLSTQYITDLVLSVFFSQEKRNKQTSKDLFGTSMFYYSAIYLLYDQANFLTEKEAQQLWYMLSFVVSEIRKDIVLKARYRHLLDRLEYLELQTSVTICLMETNWFVLLHYWPWRKFLFC